MSNIKQIGSFKIHPARWAAAKRVLPRVIANEAVNHFTKGFERGGRQTDDSMAGWTQRKKADTGRAILVQSGTLRRSIEVIRSTFRSIIVGTVGVKYARRHNEGLKGMPKREFIGDSKGLNRKIKRTILIETGVAFGKRGRR